MAKTDKKLLFLCEDLHRTLITIVHEREIKDIHCYNRWKEFASLGLSCMVLGRLKTIIILCRSHYYQEAQVLMRSMFEIIVRALDMLTDPTDKSAKEYFASEVYNQNYILEKMSEDIKQHKEYKPYRGYKSGDLRRWQDKLLSEKKELQKVFSDINFDKPQKDIKALSIQLDNRKIIKTQEKYPFLMWYNLIYRPVSSIVHGKVAFDFDCYYKKSNNGQSAILNCVNKTDPQQEEAIILTADKLVITLFDIIFKEFNIKSPDDWKKYYNEIMQRK